MKKTIFLSLGMAAMTISGFAQNAAAVNSRGAQTSGVDKAKMQADKLKEAVNLSPDQYSKVLDSLKSSLAQKQALRTPGTPPTEDARAKFKAINEDTEAKLKTILSADQYTKYQDMRKQRPAPTKAQ